VTAQTTIGGVISNPGSQINGSAWAVIMLYLLGTGLLFISFRMSSKFAGKISGFSLAAAIPALGLAAGARVAAFAGRNAVGRPALRASEGLKTRAQNAADGSWAQTLYKFGSQGLKGVGKSDFNAMRTPLGAGVAGLSNMKADALAGKKLGGAEGARKLAAKRAAENAEFLHVDKNAQKDIVRDAVKAELGRNPALQERHNEALQAAAAHDTEVKSATKDHATAQEDFVRAQAAFERTRGGDPEAAATAEQVVKNSEANLKTQADRIARATKQLGAAKQVIENIEGEAKSSAIASGTLKDFKKEGELAAHLAANRFTSAFFTDTENKKIADLARKEVNDHHEKKEAKKIADYLKEKTGDGHGHDVPKPAAAPKPEVHDTHGADHGHGDAHAAEKHDDHGHAHS
jgi:hypothetical protein